jgi:hypothetical protein
MNEVVSGLAGATTIGTLCVRRWQCKNLSKFERALARAFRAEFGHVFDLEKSNFLDSETKFETDLNQRRVLFRVAMLLDHVQEVGELFGRKHASLAGFAHRISSW